MKPPLTRAFSPSCQPADFRVDTPAANRYGAFRHLLLKEFQMLIACVSQLSGQRLRRTQDARVVGAGRPEPLGARPSMNASTPPPPPPHNCLTRCNSAGLRPAGLQGTHFESAPPGTEHRVCVSAPIGAPLVDQKHTTSKALPPRRGSGGGPMDGSRSPRHRRGAGSSRAPATALETADALIQRQRTEDRTMGGFAHALHH